MVKMNAITVAWPTCLWWEGESKDPNRPPSALRKLFFKTAESKVSRSLQISAPSTAPSPANVSSGGLVCFPSDGGGTAQIKADPLEFNIHRHSGSSSKHNNETFCWCPANLCLISTTVHMHEDSYAIGSFLLNTGCCTDQLQPGDGLA